MNLWNRLTSWIFTSGTAAQTQAGVEVTEDKALTLPAFYSGIRILAEDIGMTPLPLYKREGRGRTVAHEHPLYTLLHDAPNPRMTAMTFWSTIMYWLVQLGNAYIYKEVDELGRIVALWLLRADRVVVSMRDGNMIYTYMDANGINPQVEFTRSQVCHVVGLSKDGLVGISLLQYAAESLGISLACEQFSAEYFKNGSHFGGIIHVPANMTLSEEAQRRIAKGVSSSKGLDNAHAWRFLEEGLTAEPMNLNAQDSQMLESRQFSIVQIAQWLRIAPQKLGYTGTTTYSNLETVMREYQLESLLPWQVRIAQAVNAWILSDEDRKAGYYAEHNGNFRLIADSDKRWASHEVALRVGAKTLNKVCEEENLPQVGAIGDIHFYPLNMGVLEEVNKYAVDKDQAEIIGSLVRSGFSPDSVQAALGISGLKYLPVQPITVRPVDEDGLQVAPAAAEDVTA